MRALGAAQRRARGARRGRARIAGVAEERMLEAVTIREIERIFEVTDRLGIHRESLVIPLRPRPGGNVRRMPGGKLELVADASDFEGWLARLQAELGRLEPGR
jgi:hypothetical protein